MPKQDVRLPCGQSPLSPMTCFGYRAAREHEFPPVIPPLFEQCLLIRLPQHQPLNLQEAKESPFSPDRGKAGGAAYMERQEICKASGSSSVDRVRFPCPSLTGLFGTKRTPNGRHSGHEDKQEQSLFPSHNQKNTGMVAEGRT